MSSFLKLMATSIFALSVLACSKKEAAPAAETPATAPAAAPTTEAPAMTEASSGASMMNHSSAAQ